MDEEIINKKNLILKNFFKKIKKIISIIIITL